MNNICRLIASYFKKPISQKMSLPSFHHIAYVLINTLFLLSFTFLGLSGCQLLRAGSCHGVSQCLVDPCNNGV